MFRKIGILSLVIFIFAAVSISAQGQGRQQMTSEQQVKMLTDTLGLTADQGVKIKKIIDDNMAEMAKLREEMQNGGDMQAMRDVMTKNRTEMQTKITAVLTDDQKTKYAAYLKREQERRQNRQQAPRQQ